MVVFNVWPNHSMAFWEASGCGMELLTSHDFTNRKAFHILFPKFRPCSVKLSSKGRSLPAGEHNSMPTRTPSAPYCIIRLMGSGEFPNCLDIFRPNLSRTIPVRYTFSNGLSLRYSYPE